MLLGSSRASEETEQALVEVELAGSKVVHHFFSEEVVINRLREIGTSSIKVVAELHGDGMVFLVEIELEEHKSTLSIDG